MKECATNFGGGYFQALTDNRQKRTHQSLDLGWVRVTCRDFSYLIGNPSSNLTPLGGEAVPRSIGVLWGDLGNWPGSRSDSNEFQSVAVFIL